MHQLMPHRRHGPKAAEAGWVKCFIADMHMNCIIDFPRWSTVMAYRSYCLKVSHPCLPPQRSIMTPKHLFLKI